MNSKRIAYCFPNLLEAFFIVIALHFLELLTNALIWHLGVLAGLKAIAIADLGRVLSYGMGFAVLSWSTNFGQSDRFFLRRFRLEGGGRQIAQC
jgi:hypothetical protein